MLMLSCVHDPCIDCAARAYVELNHAKVKSKGVHILSFRLTYAKYVGRKHCSIVQQLQNLLKLLKIP